MKKTLIATSLSFAFGAFQAHAAQVEPYYLIEEIPIDGQADAQGGLQYSQLDLNVTAVSEDATRVAGKMQTFLSYFRSFDPSDRTTFDYGCQYASDVCRTFTNPEEQEGRAIGFYNLYRRTLKDQRNTQYESTIQAFYQEASANGTPSAEVVPTWDSITQKLFVFDSQANSLYTTDTRINYIAGLNDGIQLMTGYDSAPFIYNSENSRYEREFIQRGFVVDFAGSQPIQLMPDAFTDDRGGVSSGLKIIEKDGRTLVIGMASTSFANGNADQFNGCQFGEDNEFWRCSGFNTQAWVWDITDAAAGDQVYGQALVDTYLRNDNGGFYSNTPKYNVLRDINASQIFAGYASYDAYDSTSGSRGRASLYIEDEQGDYQLSQIPNIRINGDNGKFKDTVAHTWATSINDSNIVVGNLRYVEPKGRNRAVEGFVYDHSTEEVVWPLRDKPISGANSEFVSINNNGLIVGWKDGQGEDQPSYNGTTRRQTGLLVDVNRFKENASQRYEWALSELTCYVNDQGASSLPLYRIEYANHINDAGEVVASGYHYENENDFIYGVNPRPVMLKLVPNPSAGDIDNLPACPQLEEQKYTRKGASSSLGFGLLLLPLAFVRRFKKAKADI